MQLYGYQLKKVIKVKATAYDSCEICCGKTDGITKTGTKAKTDHTIAVDPKVIPLGSKVYIAELGKIYTAEDTGGKIIGNRIDIFMDTHEQAKQFGIRELTAYILLENKENSMDTDFRL
ncbi:MAG TPA: hypothetical protein DEA47_00770 [Peptococcaceae bacterium]|nr:MAG: hypothetical protein XD50_1633 [Clostridia bacterium 41_269]HBT19899.1 hypothetical protein [Peptococcaceae bacterium]